MTISINKKYFRFFLFFTSIVIANIAAAKAWYAPKPEMIERSCAIAIIEVKEVKTLTTKGEYWNYSELAAANVEKVIKGKLPNSIELLGGENFICEQCHFKAGKYLAFLKRSGDKWICANWYLSIRPIEQGQVKWYDTDTFITLSSQSLDSVLEDIQKYMKPPYVKKNSKDSCEQLKSKKVKGFEAFEK